VAAIASRAQTPAQGAFPEGGTAGQHPKAITAAPEQKAPLAISRVTVDNATPGVTTTMGRLHEDIAAPSAPRTRAETPGFLDGLEMDVPGPVNPSEWSNDSMPEQPSREDFRRGYGDEAVNQGLLLVQYRTLGSR
jgi:hypothetical protein